MRLIRLPVLYPVLICAAALGSLAGCATEDLRLRLSTPLTGSNNQDVAIQQDTQREDLDKLVSIMAYERFIHGLEAEDLELERDMLETSLATATDTVMIKLALLYTHKDAAFYDTGRALSILQSCTEHEEKTSAGVLSFSTLVAELLVETIDQEKALKVAKKKLSKEREQTEMLKDQLDALKAIEESINNRSNRMSEIIR